MDLSNAFDTINYDLLIAKLHVCSFSKDTQEIILSQFSNGFQRVEISTTFGSWLELIQGVSQGFILASILFNVYLNDILFSME